MMRPLQYEPETSIALGFGFRCGFLGLLHLEIIQERLEREYNLDLVTTAPGVIYKVHKTNGEVMDLTNPSNLPDPSDDRIYGRADGKSRDHGDNRIYRTDYGSLPGAPRTVPGNGIYGDYPCPADIHMPLNEIIYDFFDALKSRSRGYASFDYEMIGYERSELVKLDILVNKEEVDALSFIVFAGIRV